MLHTNNINYWPCSFQREVKNVKLLTRRTMPWMMTKTNCNSDSDDLKNPIRSFTCVIHVLLACIYLEFVDHLQLLNAGIKSNPIQTSNRVNNPTQCTYVGAIPTLNIKYNVKI